jgi:hypothetical protein
MGRRMMMRILLSCGNGPPLLVGDASDLFAFAELTWGVFGVNSTLTGSATAGKARNMALPQDDDGVNLPDRPSDYFIEDDRARLLPIAQLEPTRARPEGIRNAAAFMLEAARGERPRRAPLRVEPIGEGRWRILDGNSTYAVAKRSGWAALPCLVEEPRGA